MGYKTSVVFIELKVRQWKLLDLEISSATKLDVDSALQLYNSTLSIILEKKLECRYTKNKCKIDLEA